MPTIRDDDADSLFVFNGEDDELLEVPISSLHRASFPPQIPSPQPLPQAITSAAGHRPSLRSSNRPRPVEPPHNPPQPPDRTPFYIDLTGEPDSPEQERRSRNTGTQTQNARNPRRTNSQRMQTPSLARSDGTFVNRPNESFIDLTIEIPPPLPRPAEEDQRSRASHHHHHHHHHHHPPARPRPDELIELEFVRSGPRPGSASGRESRSGFAFGFSRTLAGFFSRDFIAFTAPQLDHTRTAFPPRTSPKPVMEQIAPAREGFTRGTCAEPEDGDAAVAICPSCSEELAYDPAESSVKSPSGGRKRKRAPGEHHFWAVKRCGHVYCADCFENRKRASACRGDGGFRHGPTSVSSTDFRCAVEGCDSKIASKAEWVGIYL